MQAFYVKFEKFCSHMGVLVSRTKEIILDSDSESDSYILDSKILGLESKKKWLKWTLYFKLSEIDFHVESE